MKRLKIVLKESFRSLFPASVSVVVVLGISFLSTHSLKDSICAVLSYGVGVFIGAFLSHLFPKMYSPFYGSSKGIAMLVTGTILFFTFMLLDIEELNPISLSLSFCLSLLFVSPKPTE